MGGWGGNRVGYNLPNCLLGDTTGDGRVRYSKLLIRG